MKLDLWPVDGAMPPTRAPSRWRRVVERHLPSVVIYLMVGYRSVSMNTSQPISPNACLILFFALSAAV
jgi:hypothetical protein